jgi:hypothetical protein
MKLNNDDLGRRLSALRTRYPQAVKKALLRSGTTARVEISRAMAADPQAPIPQKTAAKAIRIVVVGEEAVQLQCVGRRTPLINFKARGPYPSRGRGGGVTYSGGRADHAFIAIMPSGHRGVFERVGTARLPIRELFGPGLASLFEKYKHLGAERGREALIKNLRSEIAFAMKR